ncbi:ABC transporter ATP-binding protein [Collinsella sp. zg1085]|uniref:ATP-binding cassette domain-containing protein n=1 Tax=Collinsella sp. zg1085 TaxID=2844380 RepID=UPI001C0DD6A2|nr:ABC transporter ATP-binding protein [Collinsella sp. zg1085]QWT17983.1 ABC transporter ATP-binding protein [Collinsella sp. zg1085]
MEETKDSKMIQNQTIIKAEELCVYFKRTNTKALENISFEVGKGETIALLGHNGAGKSTLLRCIYGSLRVQSGSVKINGEIIKNYTDIFFQSEDFLMNQSMTVFENIYFRLNLLKNEKFDIESILCEYGLIEKLDTPIKYLSSGLKQRASLAFGLSSKPLLMLLDEPTNAVDPATKYLLEKKMREYKEKLATCIFATHELDFAYRVSDRILMLQNGHLIKDVQVRDLDSSEELKEMYFKASKDSLLREVI